MNKLFFNLQLFGATEDEVMEILSEIDRSYKLSAEHELEVAKLAQLKRIADALEHIAEK